MKLEDFLSVANRINHHHGVVRDEVTKLKMRIDKLRDSLKTERAALSVCNGLRTCYSPPAFFYEGRPRCFFVRHYALDEERMPTDLSGVILEEVVWGGTWMENVRVPGKSSWTVRSIELSGADVAQRTAALYAGGAVRIGSFDEVCCEPCGNCSKEALVVCEHDFDGEWKQQTLRLYRLCLHCMKVDQLSFSKYRIDKPNPLLPPSTPPKR